ncbi:FHA domain-containing protein [Arachnia propionica]|uniref:FHA domain-containing protein n=1 Tax=Arachnia propionica TaxID=1750 RepID=A0A3P1T3Z6_9ACTN|nr:FHA domain-containing protein [Arachnia propionica]MDO5082417.1 FHA domain-containing protein [Arachnia propionica]RRD04008.1 FHA domain-containing protein [Arachnia propionica]
MISSHGTPTWSPGAHMGIVWPHGLALVLNGLTPEGAGELWHRVHASAKLSDFVRSLAEVVGTGVLELPEFAVAISEGDNWHLAIRGQVPLEAQFGSTSEAMQCHTITTWTERTVLSPSALRIGEPGGPMVPVSDGVVLAGCLELGAFKPSSTVLVEETGGIPHVPEDERSDVDVVVSPPATAPTHAEERAPIGCLRMPGGELIPLGGPVVIGRHPGAGGLNLSEPARLVTIGEPHISANHLALFVEEGQAYARDLGSRNGSALRRRGGDPLRLPERSIPLEAGDVLDLGQGVLIHCDGLP